MRTPQWVETYVGGQHSADINLDDAFTVSDSLVPAPKVTRANGALNVAGLFDRLKLTSSLRRIDDSESRRSLAAS